jgi:hypothetical protein
MGSLTFIVCYGPAAASRTPSCGSVIVAYVFVAIWLMNAKVKRLFIANIRPIPIPLGHGGRLQFPDVRLSPKTRPKAAPIKAGKPHP